MLPTTAALTGRLAGVRVERRGARVERDRRPAGEPVTAHAEVELGERPALVGRQVDQPHISRRRDDHVVRPGVAQRPDPT